MIKSFPTFKMLCDEIVIDIGNGFLPSEFLGRHIVSVIIDGEISIYFTKRRNWLKQNPDLTVYRSLDICASRSFFEVTVGHFCLYVAMSNTLNNRDILKNFITEINKILKSHTKLPHENSEQFYDRLLVQFESIFSICLF
mgnify:CR=1 FL=1